MPALGDAFFFAVDNSHLWVVISNPLGDRSEFVMVNLTSLTEKSIDVSCVLEPSDYPAFIRHSTGVRYDDARLWWSDGDMGYLDLHSQRRINCMPKFSTSALRKIQLGALKSDFLAPDYLPLVKDSLMPLFPVPPPKPKAPFKFNPRPPRPPQQ